MNRDCAVCGSTSKVLFIQQKFVMPTKNAFHPGYDVVICRECGFAFADQLPSQAQMDAYYGAMNKKTAALDRRNESEPPFVAPRQTCSLKNMLPFLAPGDRILDVGCYTGSLLHRLKMEGFKNLVGLDPSPYAAAFAARNYDIEVVVGNLFDHVDLGKFDFIILTHVLEHMADLRKTLFNLSALLRSEGKIYIEVPDAHNFFLVPRHLNKNEPENAEPFLQFSFEHVNFFSRDSLANLMRRSGFEQCFLECQVSTLGILGSIWKLSAISRDNEIEAKLQKYVDECRKVYAPVLAIVDQLVSSQKEIFVWGTGGHTQRLLAQSNLCKARIHAFVDSDPAYAGGTLVGFPIIAPSAIVDLPRLPILISTSGYQDEIAEHIRKSGLQNEIIALYQDGNQ